MYRSGERPDTGTTMTALLVDLVPILVVIGAWTATGVLVWTLVSDGHTPGDDDGGEPRRREWDFPVEPSRSGPAARQRAASNELASSA
jgi:hypothetical protein